MKISRVLSTSFVAALVLFVIAACGSGGSGPTHVASASASLCTPNSQDTFASQARSIEACEQGSDSLTQIRKQPVPFFPYSQLRAELIDIEKWQADGVASKSFFYSNNGKVIFSCPSIGSPVASDSELTNPTQANWNYSGAAVIGNEDPTGVYTGQSTGTYVMCVSDTGETYAVYWEGYVMTLGAPATAAADGTVSLAGQPASLFGNIK